jgi:hypothetical protein
VNLSTADIINATFNVIPNFTFMLTGNWPFGKIHALLKRVNFKGTVSRDFLLQIFFMNHLPQAPENNTWVISNFFKNLRRYSQVKVHHQHQPE